MKKKNDFVTNSSSTSFIVSKSKNQEDLKIKLEVEVDLEKYIDEHLTTELEAIKFFRSWGFNDEEINSKPKTLKILEEIKKGNEVLVLSVSSESNDPIELFLYENGLKEDKGFIIIKGDDDF